VLVTGASGYLGTALVRRLQHAGLLVHATSRTPRASSGTEIWWEVDLTDEGATGRMISAVKPVVIWHLAGLAVGSAHARLVVPMFQANTLGTVHVLSAAQATGVRTIVLAGSLQQVWETNEGPTPYSASKAAAERAARLYSELYEMSIVLLRIGMVYGPGERNKEMLVPYVINSLLRGEHPTVTDPSRSADWVFIDDVVDALVAASHYRERSSLDVEIGSGVAIPVGDVVRTLYRLLGFEWTSSNCDFESARDRHVRGADVGGATDRIGWRPRTQLEVGLQRTVEWWKNRATVYADP
jgi:nucleoside-diphosphate-sugar epimerase